MEITPDNAAALAKRVPKQRIHRSAISNGSRLFAVAGADCRTLTGRRFRDLVEIMTADLAGADLLSEFQKQLIRRTAALSVMAEAIECDVVQDFEFDILTYGTVCDRLRRLCETLGLKRVAREVEVTPMDRLKQYQDAKKAMVISPGSHEDK